MMPTTLTIQTGSSCNQLQQKIKATKVTKVRRTRQPRNPQASVARRNERERNRVKMVNNGFALLRDHLPVEDLQACEQSGSETPTPDGGSVNGGSNNKSGKGKKFSKVETLRAAIQRIRMLEELIRSTEPGFESINITSSNSAQFALYDEEPLSVGEPLSCGSSHSNSTGTMHMEPASVSSQQQLYISGVQQQHSQQQQFIKLEPQPQPQQQPINLPSPQHSQTSHTSGLNSNNQPQQYPATQVHLHHHQQQQQQHLQSTHMSNHLSQQQQQEPSHTHLWIQQHQSSFMEQQQNQYQQQQQQQQSATNWYSQQAQPAQSQMDQKSNWFVHESPDTINGQQHHPQEQQHLSHHHHQQQQQLNHHHHQSQIDSPVWFSGSPPSAIVQSQPMSTFAGHHQHHQISLYSQ